ncbi:hypothetical protein L3X38_040546 [Prunus dulcis]|uniref:Ubiquitin-like domain-containing protein n=1 Tax=Prunus dulcis TaxID=3755 RepID=A0AAD4V9P9_PRUDU|nr:hypothetical protein L3X38_040546 [Prunus dulcis]
MGCAMGVCDGVGVCCDGLCDDSVSNGMGLKNERRINLTGGGVSLSQQPNTKNSSDVGEPHSSAARDSERKRLKLISGRRLWPAKLSHRFEDFLGSVLKRDFLSPPAPIQFRVEEWPCISVLSVRLILVSTGEVLEDSKSLADQKVENDAVVALTLRKDDNEFEEVNIVRADDFYQSRDADAGNW